MSPGDQSEPPSYEFSGEYTRRQGKQFTYLYFASIFPIRDGYRWTAEIWRAGNVMGAPAGKVGKGGQATLMTTETRVREMVFHCIEYLVDVSE